MLITVTDTCHDHVLTCALPQSERARQDEIWCNIPIVGLAVVAGTGSVHLVVAVTRLAAVLAAAVVVEDVVVPVGWAATWTAAHFGSTVQAALVIDTS